ncbi:MAG: DMT family transporter, partial [Aggregatilineales bacterium]
LTAFFSLQRLPAGVYVLLFYSYPAMVAVIAALLGERLSRRAWAALGLALAGVALTVPDCRAGLSSEAWVGVLLALLNALAVALYFVFNNRLLRGRTGLAHASAWVITGAMGVMLTLALARPVNPAPDATSWLYLLALALVCTVLPVFTLTAGIQKLGASKAAIAGTLEPVLTIVLAALILGEMVQAGQLAGGALILASILLLQSAPRRQTAVIGEATAAGG